MYECPPFYAETREVVYKRKLADANPFCQGGQSGDVKPDVVDEEEKARSEN